MENSSKPRPSHIEVIWGDKVLDKGFTSIPNLLIRNYRKLGIEHGEFGVLLQILTHQHDARAPYPSRKTIADYQGVSVRQIDKWLEKLEEKGLLRVGQRRNKKTGEYRTSVYDFSPLVGKLLGLVSDSSADDTDDYCIDWGDGSEPEVQTVNDDLQLQEVPEVQMDVVPQVHTVAEPEVQGGTEPEVQGGTEPEVQPKIKRENNYTTTTATTGGGEIESLYLSVKSAMRGHLPRYELKSKDYQEVRNLIQDGIPSDFMLRTISTVFEIRSDASIRSFTYCAEVIRDLWHVETEKEIPVRPQRKIELTGSQHDNYTRTKRNSAPSGSKQDDRYEEFYKLFPEEL